MHTYIIIINRDGTDFCLIYYMLYCIYMIYGYPRYTYERGPSCQYRYGRYIKDTLYIYIYINIYIYI